MTHEGSARFYEFDAQIPNQGWPELPALVHVGAHADTIRDGLAKIRPDLQLYTVGEHGYIVSPRVSDATRVAIPDFRPNPPLTGIPHRVLRVEKLFDRLKQVWVFPAQHEAIPIISDNQYELLVQLAKNYVKKKSVDNRWLTHNFDSTDAFLVSMYDLRAQLNHFARGWTVDHSLMRKRNLGHSRLVYEYMAPIHFSDSE